MPIDTKVKGNPESIRGAAGWVRDSLASGVSEAGTQIYNARNSADAGWRGEASEAFRNKMTAGARKGDDFADAAKTMAQKFDDIAADLQRAQQEMERIRGEAAAARLRVDGETIHTPGPAPAAPGPAPTGETATPEAVRAHVDAVTAQDAHADKVTAYQKAEREAEAARRQWEGSVEALNQTTNSVGEKAWFTVGDIANTTAAAAVAGKHSSILLKHSQFLLNDAKQALRHVTALHDPYTGVVVDRDAMYRNLDRANASTRAASTAADDAAKVRSRGHSAGLKLGGALAVGGVVYEIVHGKDPVQAAVSGASGFGASVAAGAAAGAAFGTIFPGAGNIVGAGVGAIVGAGVGVFTSGMIDSLWENGVGDVGDAVVDGAAAVADTGEAIKEGVVGGANAVSGGVKDAWDSIF